MSTIIIIAGTWIGLAALTLAGICVAADHLKRSVNRSHVVAEAERICIEAAKTHQ